MTGRLEAINRKQIKMGLVREQYELKDPTLIGRGEDRDIRIPVNTISRTHAKIFWDKESRVWNIIDQGSQNGTVLTDIVVEEGKLLTKTIKLEAGKAYKLKNWQAIYLAELPLIFVGG